MFNVVLILCHFIYQCSLFIKEICNKGGIFPCVCNITNLHWSLYKYSQCLNLNLHFYYVQIFNSKTLVFVKIIVFAKNSMGTFFFAILVHIYYSFHLYKLNLIPIYLMPLITMIYCNMPFRAIHVDRFHRANLSVFKTIVDIL